MLHTVQKRHVFGLLICITIIFQASIFADEPASSGISTGTELNFVAATTLETKLKLLYTINVPFLAGDGPLNSGNSMNFQFGAELSPVSVNGTAEATWTPIAFFQISAGASVGTGWNIPIADGLRINERIAVAPGVFENSKLTGSSFLGIVWSAKTGAVLQADYAAFRPGDWNHIVFRTYQSLQYRSLSSAGTSDSWLYEADSGQNRNGWNYYGNYFLGYNMPIFIDMVGILTESNLYLYDTPGRELWGDQLTRWTFGSLIDFTITPKVSAALIVQMKTGVNYTKETEKYTFYQDRRVVEDDTNYIQFYRIAINATVKLR